MAAGVARISGVRPGLCGPGKLLSSRSVGSASAVVVVPSHRLSCGFPRARWPLVPPRGLVSVAQRDGIDGSVTVVAHVGGRQFWWSAFDRPGWWWLFGLGEIPGGLSITDMVTPAGAAGPS